MNVGLCVVCCAVIAWLLWAPDRDRALLESRYHASPADMRQVGEWRLHVRDSGTRDAPAVILVHGFGSCLQTWNAWAQGLSRKFRVIRFDLPGSGLSAPDPAADYTDARSLQLILTLMDTLKLQRASIVGHSVGGCIAWTFAA